LEEEVGDAQDIFLEWLAAEIELLKQALGVGFEVRVTFDKMNLRDPEKFMAILLQLYQGGVIDPETTVSTMGFHFPTIVNRMKDAIKLRKSGLFMPIPSSNNLGPDGMILPRKMAQPHPRAAGSGERAGRPYSPRPPTSKSAEPASPRKPRPA